jgi:hypothetical protein
MTNIGVAFEILPEDGQPPPELNVSLRGETLEVCWDDTASSATNPFHEGLSLR